VLKAIRIQGFKSLADTGRVELSPLTVLVGPNAAGKSNVLDAVQLLSRLASEKTLADAFNEPLRGLPLETFSLPPGGLAELLSSPKPCLRLDADIETGSECARYAVGLAIKPRSGVLTVEDEFLGSLGKDGQPKGQPRIEQVDGRLRVRRRSQSGKPRYDHVGLGYTILSDRRYAGSEYRLIERVRDELGSWRTYYLDPRVAMRRPQAPREVTDIGPLGEYLGPYLYRLDAEQDRVFAAVKRTLRAIVPSIQDVTVRLDRAQATIDVEITQDGTPYSARVVSEGTLRILALACVATNPWTEGLIAFEEPENGVHPRRIELIADLLASITDQRGRQRQVLVTTHSPVLAGRLVQRARQAPDSVGLYKVVREGRVTHLRRLDTDGPLFDDAEVAAALTAPSEDRVLEAAMLRGFLDE
jgi:predicted ATPase